MGIVKSLTVNSDLSAEMVVSGNFSHYHNTDNPIVEIFRAINLARMSDKTLPYQAMHYTVGLPSYNKQRKTTKCIFRLNAASYIPTEENLSPEDRLAEMAIFMEQDFIFFKKEMGKTLRNFVACPSGYPLYMQYVRNIEKADKIGKMEELWKPYVSEKPILPSPKTDSAHFPSSAPRLKKP